MSDELFREVDEEVRQDRFQQLWKRYSAIGLAVVVLIVGATVAFVVWRDSQLAAKEADGSRFLAAVMQEKTQRDEAITALREIARDGTAGYRFLASLREAALLAEAGDVAEAVAIFDALATDDAFAGPYRDVARISAVARGMESMSVEEVEERLFNLNVATNPFRATAREFLAVSAIRAGNEARADELLRANLDDRETPASVRVRANELLALIGN
ncbi:MAG: tetratricopeptide repeat protein [Alphaproteobacteria bacterium]|nr:tetratricopeptide repeat protein [Alphaproteobacteria bacterium]